MGGQEEHVPKVVKFIISATSGVCSTLACFPLDLLKIRLQVMGAGTKERTNMLIVGKHIMSKYGPLGFYDGLSASVMRQILYTGARMALFQEILDQMHDKGFSTGFFSKVFAGTVSGAIGAVAGLPADVCMTRMASDATLPRSKQRKYKNVIHAIFKIYRREGFPTLYKGLVPTVIRAMLLNVAQLTSYQEAREFFIRRGWSGEENSLHAMTSFISAFTAVVVSLPPDIAKIRLQNQQKGGGVQYAGMLDVMFKVVKAEGIFALWKGFWPMFIRNLPQFFVLFFVYEHLMLAYKHAAKHE